MSKSYSSMEIAAKHPRKPKKLQHTIEKSIPSNSPRPKSNKSQNDYPLIDSLYMEKMSPVSDKILTKLAYELIEWLEDESQLVLGKFLAKKKLSWDSFLTFCKRNEYLSHAHKLATTTLGARREEKYLNPHFVEKTQPLYDPQFKDLEEWRSNLKSKIAEAGKATNTIVVAEYPAYPDNDFHKFPEKKD